MDQIIKYVFSGRAQSIEKSLKEECILAGDLVLRETVRRTFKGIKKQAILRPPIGLPGPQLTLPPPPVLVPGKGLKPMEQVVEAAFPALELTDEIYAQGLLELILNFLGLNESILDNPIQP